MVGNTTSDVLNPGKNNESCWPSPISGNGDIFFKDDVAYKIGKDVTGPLFRFALFVRRYNVERTPYRVVDIILTRERLT